MGEKHYKEWRQAVKSTLYAGYDIEWLEIVLPGWWQASTNPSWQSLTQDYFLGVLIPQHFQPATRMQKKKKALREAHINNSKWPEHTETVLKELNMVVIIYYLPRSWAEQGIQLAQVKKERKKWPRHHIHSTSRKDAWGFAEPMMDWLPSNFHGMHGHFFF